MLSEFLYAKGVTAGQLRKIVVKYLNENPEGLYFAASTLVSIALYYAFPPSKKDDGTRYGRLI